MAILLKLQKIQQAAYHQCSILCDNNMHIAQHYTDNIKRMFQSILCAVAIMWCYLGMRYHVRLLPGYFDSIGLRPRWGANEFYTSVCVGYRFWNVYFSLPLSFTTKISVAVIPRKLMTSQSDLASRGWVSDNALARWRHCAGTDSSTAVWSP